MRKKAQHYGRDKEWKNLQSYVIRVFSFYSIRNTCSTSAYFMSILRNALLLHILESNYSQKKLSSAHTESEHEKRKNTEDVMSPSQKKPYTKILSKSHGPQIRLPLFKSYWSNLSEYTTSLGHHSCTFLMGSFLLEEGKRYDCSY